MEDDPWSQLVDQFLFTHTKQHTNRVLLEQHNQRQTNSLKTLKCPKPGTAGAYALQAALRGSPAVIKHSTRPRPEALYNPYDDSDGGGGGRMVQEYDTQNRHLIEDRQFRAQIPSLIHNLIGQEIALTRLDALSKKLKLAAGSAKVVPQEETKKRSSPPSSAVELQPPASKKRKVENSSSGAVVVANRTNPKLSSSSDNGVETDWKLVGAKKINRSISSKLAKEDFKQHASRFPIDLFPLRYVLFLFNF
jgi:hypothetical protein